MATLVFTALGTALGGPLGGAIGALVGRQVDGLVIGAGTREGPRLKELAITTSSYGTAVPRVLGRMRMPGTIIWATDLVEHRDRQGGGKGKPSTVTYAYSASFAVALSSRRVGAIGRIWADGNLLRGVAGDLKVPGAMRFHDGSEGQACDPLLAAAEGFANTPAHRGLAYVVFEDLQLGDFGNRIPALSFEVFADEGPFNVEALCEGAVADVDAAVSLAPVVGMSCDGPLGEVLASLDPLFPLDCDVSGERLVLAREAATEVITLTEPARAVADDAFGADTGSVRRREAGPLQAIGALRYYDIDRDYQPGIQRVSVAGRRAMRAASTSPVRWVPTTRAA